jgi:hypothetical protein
MMLAQGGPSVDPQSGGNATTGVGAAPAPVVFCTACFLHILMTAQAGYLRLNLAYFQFSKMAKFVRRSTEGRN